MTEQNTATKGTRRTATSANGEASGKFTDEERAAAKERARELHSFGVPADRHHDQRVGTAVEQRQSRRRLGNVS